MSIDPITLTVIQAGLQQVCDEMDMTFSRAAFSPVIAEANDRSDGIYSSEDGSLIAQGANGLPVFVGTMQYSTRTLIEMIAANKVASPVPGDIYIVNDPYLGGTHLMDVRFAMPVYRDGQIFCWLSNTGHWPDTGGAVPGGFSASATSVEQEGLRLPPVRLFKQGQLDAEIYSIICSNIRVSEQRIGDVKAQASALLIGEERLSRILDRYGDDTVREAIAELRVRASQQMRDYLRLIPDGVYRSVAYVDSDGVVNEPLEIKLAITAYGGELEFDFSGSSKPCMGPMNSVLATTLSSVYLAIRHIFPDVPISAGAFEPLKVKRPVGTFLDAHYPRPVSGCAAEVSQRIAEAVFTALVEALPDRVTAAPAGSSGNFALGGYDPERDRDFVMYQLSGGGYGGNADNDGISNGCSTIGISKAPPIEIMEQQFPVLYHRYALREGSGGAGRHRGGFGLDYELELRRGHARASFVMDHGRFGPPGVLGGKDGAPNIVTVWRDGESMVPEHLSKAQDIPLKQGDRVRIGTPGGGGYGLPTERNPAAVAEDVRLGRYTPAQALALFNVVVSSTGELDQEEKSSSHSTHYKASTSSSG
ncbi:hydantoinase B/oxoprolinase family protein [Pararhizobium sp. YC-54]|uniref:hydantoinase B/oxoprolinase family protein n=1 Tax=Pararhizobium sp. YC-54 TaxID=2986920 RepID=UPI0021F6F3DC|nr:hydantoinase B/oxoprolinase family protein [Pararhizobium sp. YC-54]MCW0001529.1 hydantoinase B/oxoprolinase family protein [Pararhizobium sp. YC-54]